MKSDMKSDLKSEESVENANSNQVGDYLVLCWLVAGSLTKSY